MRRPRCHEIPARDAGLSRAASPSRTAPAIGPWRHRWGQALQRHGGAVVCLLAILATPSAAWAGGGGHRVIENIAISLVAAAAAAVAMKVLRQPLLLGYILAGVAIGPIGLGIITDHKEIITVSEIGLILLLFMIGLEIDIRAMIKSGRRVIIPGLLQFPISVATAYGVFLLLERAGIFLGTGSYARLYVAIGVSLSSTMIVVKLLFDKMELDTLPGRITIGILIFQDIWAIIVLAIQPNLNNPELLGLLRTFGSGALLVAAAMLLSRYVLPSLFRGAAKMPELVLVMSLGWCFLVALVAAHPWVGLSMEMGALIAGVSLATFPYNLDVVAKATTVRDFFITLFFVALGMQIPLPTMNVMVVALAIVAVALFVKWLGIFGVLYATGGGLRVANLAAINLGQVSEFSLVILTLGIGFGHIEGDTLTYVIWVFALLAVASTYCMTYSHGLQTALSKLQRSLGVPDVGDRDGDAAVDSGRQRVVVLGFFRIASAFLETLRQRQPALLSELLVVDFNPVVKQKLDAMGVACIYGDIANQDTLHHAAIHDAEMVLCTIPDTFLKGTDNKRLLAFVRSVAPNAHVVVTADSPSQAQQLYEQGADFVLQPSSETAQRLADVVEEGLGGHLAPIRNEALETLSNGHAEVLS